MKSWCHLPTNENCGMICLQVQFTSIESFFHISTQNMIEK
jgi:hypothetical protein